MLVQTTKTSDSSRWLSFLKHVFFFFIMSGLKWKRDSSCKAHVILDKMFAENKIDPNALPASVYKLSPEFQKYSKDVFRTAFGQLKTRYGLARKYFTVIVLMLYIIFKRFFEF